MTIFCDIRSKGHDSSFKFQVCDNYAISFCCNSLQDPNPSWKTNRKPGTTKTSMHTSNVRHR
ncbi:hypothetical protein K0M31_000186 [Melipona bicolor]|uniref:Uncharacterized protein n=1 Tax=Melipona bicolor TaxID=60889 RepID=A0AA40GCZ6_9HYME|nr:hypothetical protein K0M31_000186 [Melipona bicolor]